MAAPNTDTSRQNRTVEITSIQGFGPPAGDSWLYFVVGMDYVDDLPLIPGAPVLHRRDAALAVALDAHENARAIDVVIEVRPLPEGLASANSDRPELGAGQYPVLVAVGGVSVDLTFVDEGCSLPEIGPLG